MKSIANKLIKYILNGEPVIIPTDTVYGLICRFDSKKAVDKIYNLKKRNRKKPLILLGYNWQNLKKFVNVGVCCSKSLKKLLNQWPGPLTIVLPASKYVPRYLNKGFSTIGVRVPDNKFLLKILKKSPGKVLASTSANISGKKDVKEIAQKVKLFIRATKGEMSNKPSRVIEINNEKIKRLR